MLQERLASSQSQVESIDNELRDAQETLQTRASTIHLQDKELEYLRQALMEAEDEAETIGDGFLRRAKDAERVAESLRQQLADLTEEVTRKDAAVSQAFTAAEMERANAIDAKSRLNAFTSEIDRLSLANAELKKEVDDIRRDSSSSNIKVIELEKTITSLEHDKELLNIALESKQTEVTLLQRQLGQGTPRPRSSLIASTSRVTRPSVGDVTPVPTRMLSKSVSNNTTRPHSRASSVSATPTPIAKVPAPRVRATPTPTPLGTSTRHNRTPEKRQGVRKVITSQSSVENVKPSLSRRSSLPVMKGSSVDLSRNKVSGQMDMVGEETE